MVVARIVVSFCLMQLICGSCPPGRYGDACSYSCHCGSYCDVTTGACGGDCDAGWVGGQGNNCQKQNVAYQRQASSPIDPQRPSWTPDKAVDGDRGQNVNNNNTCFHPAIPPSPPSEWTVDMGRVYRLHDVRIYNRKGYVYRIRGVTINLHNTSSATGVTCYTFPNDTQEAEGVYDVTCDGRGRYLTIKLNTETLNLCEVEVYVCSNGSYGTNCNQCGRCLNDTCDTVSGVCPGACGPEWKGPQCQECRDGRYGIHCDQFCNSRNCITTSSSCDVTGACTDGCRDGWLNTDCRQLCPGSTYGPSCSKSCNSRHCQTPSSSCDHVTGDCDGGVCEDGWIGTDCAETCKAGTYWPDCSRCGHCDVTCDVMDGHCPGRCLDGFTGVRCHVDTRTQTMSTVTAASPVRVCSHVMWSMIGGAVGIVVTLLLVGALIMCLLRTGRLSWRSADVNQAVKMSDVIDKDQSSEGSQQTDSEAGVTNVYSGLDDVTKADNGAYGNI